MAEHTDPIEVLLVEDSSGDALLIAKILKDCPIPVKLHVARDGMQALLMLASGNFDPGLVIVDLNIPNLSGFGVIEHFHPKDIPVVVFSGSSSEADMRRALALGAREYVLKPTDLAAYGDAVLRMLETWAVREKGHAAGESASV